MQASGAGSAFERLTTLLKRAGKQRKTYLANTPTNGDSPLGFRRAWDAYNQQIGRAMEIADRRVEKADAAVTRAKTAAEAL